MRYGKVSGGIERYPAEFAALPNDGRHADFCRPAVVVKSSLRHDRTLWEKAVALHGQYGLKFYKSRTDNVIFLPVPRPPRALGCRILDAGRSCAPAEDPLVDLGHLRGHGPPIEFSLDQRATGLAHGGKFVRG